MSDAENFGQRMHRLKVERNGRDPGGPGRRSIAETYRRQIGAVERTFADALPALAQTYVDELWTKEPETCPDHRRVLACPVQGCGYHSDRTEFDHKAAAYAFDRLLGRPTSRSENALYGRRAADAHDLRRPHRARPGRRSVRRGWDGRHLPRRVRRRLTHAADRLPDGTSGWRSGRWRSLAVAPTSWGATAGTPTPSPDHRPRRGISTASVRTARRGVICHLAE